MVLFQIITDLSANFYYFQFLVHCTVSPFTIIININSYNNEDANVYLFLSLTDDLDLLPQQREATTYPIEPPDKGYATLDPNHTHHFLVDDGLFSPNSTTKISANF